MEETQPWSQMLALNDHRVPTAVCRRNYTFEIVSERALTHGCIQLNVKQVLPMFII